MANFKRDIEDSILTHSDLSWMFKEFRGFDETSKKHLRVETKSDTTGEYFDTDHVTVFLISSEPIQEHIEVRSVINALQKLEDKEAVKGIRKAILLDQNITESDGIWTAVISFLVINNKQKLSESHDIVSPDKPL